MGQSKLLTFFKNNRLALEKDLIQKKKWIYFSPATYCQFMVMLPLADRYAHGKLIDLGCGNMPYREHLISQVDSYDGLDMNAISDEIRFKADIENMKEIGSDVYESALLLEVLEHTAHPWQAIKEVHRILVPQGILILTVPHLSRLHEEPHDYYRFTEYGLRTLLTDAGFEVMEMKIKGGMCSFIGHQISVVVLSLVWPVPLLRELVFFINSWLNTRLLYELDRFMFKKTKFPLGYAVAAKKQ